MGLTLPCRGEEVQAVPGAAGPLREFRERLHGCLTARGDALFELADAVLCSDRPVRSLVQLSLEPEFRRGHGALYDALAAGRVDDERLFDAGYSAAALTDGLAGCPAHVLVRLPAGSVFYQDAPSWPGKNGRPARRGPEVCCLEPDALAAAGEGRGSRGRKKPLPPAPEPDETLTLPGTPLYGTVRAEAWHGVHPQVHGDRGWFAGRDKLPVLRGTLVHVTAGRLPDGRDPHRQLWLWHAGPGPLSLDELWRAYLARFDIEHAIRTLKGTLGLTTAKVRAPEQADRWVRVVIAAHAQLLLARPLAADLRWPWEKHPDPDRPLTPGRVRRGFRNIRRALGTPARVPKPARPGPGRPKGSSKGHAPRHLLPGEADMPRTAHTLLTRKKAKSKD